MRRQQPEPRGVGTGACGTHGRSNRHRLLRITPSPGSAQARRGSSGSEPCKNPERSFTRCRAVVVCGGCVGGLQGFREPAAGVQRCTNPASIHRWTSTAGTEPYHRADGGARHPRVRVCGRDPVVQPARHTISGGDRYEPGESLRPWELPVPVASHRHRGVGAESGARQLLCGQDLTRAGGVAVPRRRI